MHIQQSGRLRIIRRFKNLNPVDSSRERIKVIQIIPPRALRRGTRNVFYVAHSFAPILQSNSSEVQSAQAWGRNLSGRIVQCMIDFMRCTMFDLYQRHPPIFGRP
jgi:hypothetical protein